MAALNIRDLPSEVHARLRLRAAKAGRSMEAEARAILTSACLTDTTPEPAESLQDWVAKIYRGKRPRGVADELITQRRAEADAE